MLVKMIQNNLKTKLIFLILFFLNSNSYTYSKIMILSECNNIKDGFVKNEYILDLEKLLMTRNYIYDAKTYKRHHLTDLSVKKKNSLTRTIYKEEGKILTDKLGYPQFYTQLLFEIDNPNIMIKTVINNEEGISSMSNCKKIERFKIES